MKKNLLGGKAGKIILAVNCLILAIVFWFAVKMLNLGEPSSSMFWLMEQVWI